MIKKIHLENFMAHKATSIELSPGVTVITGPNNIGKSAIVEAIRYLVYNPAPKNVIRHGAKKAVVRLELDSGEIITWQRQDKNASYALYRPNQGDEEVQAPPEEYHKFGRAVPDDVRSLLRLEQVETDTDSLDIHLGNQRQPIFLLDRPGSHAAGFFAASTEADYLLKMQQALKVRIEQAKKDRKRLDTELVAIARQLGQYEPLDDLEVKISQAEALYAAILETERQIPLLEEIINQNQQTQDLLDLEEQSAGVLELLESPPVLEEITGLALLLSELTDKTRQRHLEATRTSVLTNLTSPPALDATVELETLLVQSQATESRYTTAQAHSRILAALNPLPDTAEVEKLQELVRTYDEALENCAALRKHQTILAPQAEPPHLEEVSSLDDLVVRLDREQARYDRVQDLTRFLAELQTPPETATLLDLENSLSALRQGTADISRQQAHLAALAVQLDQKKAEIQLYLQDTGFMPPVRQPPGSGAFFGERACLISPLPCPTPWNITACCSLATLIWPPPRRVSGLMIMAGRSWRS